MNKFILVLAEHRRTKLNITKRLFQTCSSSSPSLPHSSSFKLYDVIFVFSFPMFRCVFFSLVFLWSFSLSSFSALPHSSTRILVKIAERQEFIWHASHLSFIQKTPPKKNAWMSPRLNLHLCHCFSSNFPERNKTRVYETCLLWPFIMKLSPFLWRTFSLLFLSCMFLVPSFR